jgi:hypothetical protein
MIESGSNPDSDEKHCKKHPVHVAGKYMPGHARITPCLYTWFDIFLFF